MPLLEIVVQAPPLLEVILDQDGSPEVQLITGGLQGPPGLGADLFEQSFASAPVWIVNHNLARSPATVRVLTPGGIEVEASVTETSLNQIVISFASAQAGRVIIF